MNNDPITPMSNIKHVIAIASGKGGVGKSTVAVNFAMAFVQGGKKAGILDADFYGPSVPQMLGLEGRIVANDKGKILPLEKDGLKTVSVGNLIEEGTPIIWRTPMIHGFLRKLFDETEWGDLDILIVDLPPGTGDAPLSIAKLVPLSGVVIVCTPQKIALADARRAIAMFVKLEIPILGLIENMSFFVCPHCGQQSDIFARGGVKEEAERQGLPFLGEVPINMQIRTLSDSGLTVFANEHELASVYLEISGKLWKRIKQKE